jgi:outer membrane protein TolC
MIRRTSKRWAVVGLALCLMAQPGLAQEVTLQDALDAAMASHPAVGAASARRDGADAAASAARAQRLPSVATSASVTRFAEPMLVSPLHAFDPTNIPDFETSLVRGELAAQYTLYEGGARSARIRGADALVGAARWSAEHTEAELMEQVTAAYLGVLSAREVHEAAQRQMAALSAERDRANRHVSEGTAPRVEALRAEAALLDVQAQTTSAAARVGLAERTLARLMGVEADRIEGRAIQAVSPMAGGDLEVAAHPLVERSRQMVDGARARVDQQRASRLPSLSASAGILDYGTLGSKHVAEWQAGFRVSWPIFTGGARGASIRRAEADLRAAEDELRMARLQIDNAGDAAEAALLEAQSRAEALEAAVVQWQEVARIERLSLQEGAGMQSDLLRAEAGLFQARAGSALARHEAILATVRLARARGVLSMNWMNEALEAVR